MLERWHIDLFRTDPDRPDAVSERAGWANQEERGTRRALRTILWIALRLGRPAARSLLYPITLYFLLKAKPQRLASRRFLSGIMGRPVGLAQVAKHIHCFAATILDRVYLLAGRHAQFDVRLHGEELLVARLEASRGFLLLGSHLGSFEILRALAVEREHIPLKILMRPAHNQVITSLLHALNPQVASTVIPLGSPGALLAVKEALDKAQVVGLLADRFAPGEPFVRCSFFDKPAPFPTGPLALAAATKVPVLLIFGLYRGGNRYDIHFEQFAEQVVLDERPRREALGEWVQRYAVCLERYTRIAPYNWFNFYDFWDEGGSTEGTSAQGPKPPWERRAVGGA